MAYVPNGSFPHLVKASNNTPVGTLATFSLDSAAVPVDPRDSSGQIPTLSATVTDLGVPVNTLIDDDVTFRDWTGSDTTAKVKSVRRGASSGLTVLDTSTLFDRLNTEQTTFPFILPESSTVGATLDALEHWCLMAGITKYRTPGNLLQAIPSRNLGTIGYLADNPAALRTRGYDSGGGYLGFVPTIGTFLPNIEVNPAQSMMLGAMFSTPTELASIRITAWAPNLQATAVYTLRRMDNTFSVIEKVGTAAPVTLLSATYVPVSPTYLLSVNLLVKANEANPNKADLTLRVMEWGGASTNSNTEDIYTDFTATAVTSTLTGRPVPYQIDLGYDDALVGSRTLYGDVSHYYMSEGSVLPEKFPAQQTSISTPLTPEFLANDPRKVPGFTANVWEKIKEFCSITEMDVFFEQEAIRFSARQDSLIDDDGTSARAPLRVSKGNVSISVENREVSKYVDVLCRKMVGDENTFTNTEMWRADTVYSLNKGEYKEEVVQTDSTFTVLHQPIAVTGVPVPYTWGYGSYVVTGNDGYIVDPKWWQDNGGSIRTEQTGKAGEIKIMMQAPGIDTVRAPYRISEGVADRPALYLFGSGLNLSKPETVRIATGAGDAAQVSVTFDSPFLTSMGLAYNAGFKVADAMGGAGGSISFEVSKSTLAVPDPYGAEYSTLPQGSTVYQDGAIHRIAAMSMRPSGLTISQADQFTTIAATNDGLGADATIDDWNTLHAGKSVKEVNLSPLPLYIS